MSAITEVENLSKLYKLGTIGAGTLRDSISQWYQKIRGLECDRAPHISPYTIPAERAGPRPNTMWALKDITFTIDAGETVGILGRNGAGKSTLLKLLSRITEPTSGHAVLRGRLASLLEVGTGFHPELTGRENIFLNGVILGMNRAEVATKLDAIVEFSEVGGFLDTPVKRYSSGMLVRLAFSVAAHLEPEILVVDEVLAVGDLAFQSKCIAKMKSLTKMGKTLLFVSHNLYLLQTLCQRGIFLSNGQLRYDGTIDKAVAAYRSELIANQGTELSGNDSLESPQLKLVDWTFNGSSDRWIRFEHPQSLTVEWTLGVKQPVTVYVGFVLKSAEGNYITGLSSFLEGKGYTLSVGTHRGQLFLPLVDLAAGSYRMNLSIMDDNGTPVYAHLNEAGILSVERKASFDGLVGLEHEWRIQ